MGDRPLEYCSFAAEDGPSVRIALSEPSFPVDAGRQGPALSTLSIGS